MAIHPIPLLLFPPPPPTILPHPLYPLRKGVEEGGVRKKSPFILVPMKVASRLIPNPVTSKPIIGPIPAKNPTFAVGKVAGGNSPDPMSWLDITENTRVTGLSNVDYVNELFPDQITWLCIWNGTLPGDSFHSYKTKSSQINVFILIKLGMTCMFKNSQCLKIHQKVSLKLFYKFATTGWVG